jgi:hypothetical protein
MSTGLFRIAIVALAANLSACAASAQSPRIAMTQASGLQLHRGTIGPAPDCAYDGSSFNRPEGMQLPKDACSPQ